MKRLIATAAAAATLLVPGAALAHHPLGGTTPATLTDGLLSGIGHPILGLDHLAFIVVMGVAAMLAGRRLSAPLAYIATMLVGVALHLAAVTVPFAEAAIALSLLGVGAMVASGRSFAAPVWLGAFALAGLFHGFAFGESIYGAEATPLVAYLVGLGVTQWAIAVLAGLAAVSLANASRGLQPARLAGAAVMGMGLLLAGEQAIGAVFGA